MEGFVAALGFIFSSPVYRVSTRAMNQYWLVRLKAPGVHHLDFSIFNELLRWCLQQYDPAISLQRSNNNQQQPGLLGSSYWVPLTNHFIRVNPFLELEVLICNERCLVGVLSPSLFCYSIQISLICAYIFQILYCFRFS